MTELLAFHKAVAALDEAVRALEGGLPSFRAARPPERAELIARIDAVCGASLAVHQTLAKLAAAAEEPVPSWVDRQALDEIATGFAERAGERAGRWRERLKELAAELGAGRVLNRFTRRVNRTLDGLRLAAQEELDRRANEESPLLLPGPCDGRWLGWVWQQPGEQLESLLEPLRDPTPNFYQLLLDLDPNDWQAAPVGGQAIASASPAEVQRQGQAETCPPESSPAGAAVPTEPEAGTVCLPLSTPDPEEVAAPQTAPLAVSPATQSLGQAMSGSAPSTPPALPPGRRFPALERRLRIVSDPDLAPTLITSELVTAPPAAPVAPRPEHAGAAEIVARCVEGDYLRAALLAAGRAFAGAEEVDPRFEALIAAHHVLRGSRLPPWPEWCYDPAAAAEVCHTAPESARLVFLAAHLHLSLTEGIAPLSDRVNDELIKTFNDLPEVRTWLTAFKEVMAIPGLWEQVCRPAPPDPKGEYRDRRKAFEERYAQGLLHRYDKAAYIHRLDNYLSRQPPFRKLMEYLAPAGPGNLAADGRQHLAALLQNRPGAVVDDWLQATGGAAGKVKLRGNQRNELEHRAEEYLDLASRAWRAGESLQQAPPTQGDVDRRRKQLRDLLPAALIRAQGKVWRPLLDRLAGGMQT